MPLSFSKFTAGPFSASRVMIPMNWTPWLEVSYDTVAKCLDSSRQGPHHEPHTFSTTTLPL